MSRYSVIQEISAKLRDIPNAEFYEGKTTEEIVELVKRPIAPGEQIKPFITVNYGSMIKPRKGTNGIVGAKTNSNIMEFTVRTVANTYRNSEKVMQEVWDTIVGFVPTNAGEIDSVLYGGVGEINSLGSPQRFASVQSFACMVNSDFTEIL